MIAQEEAVGLGIGFMILWGLFCLVLFLVSLGIYFVPLFIASIRKHEQIVALGALNVLLGWTFVGWALAIVWALMNPRQPQVVMMPQSQFFPAQPPQPKTLASYMEDQQQRSPAQTPPAPQRPQAQTAPQPRRPSQAAATPAQQQRPQPSSPPSQPRPKA
jgi:hypothetical protein